MHELTVHTSVQLIQEIKVNSCHSSEGAELNIAAIIGWVKKLRIWNGMLQLSLVRSLNLSRVGIWMEDHQRGLFKARQWQTSSASYCFALFLLNNLSRFIFL